MSSHEGDEIGRLRRALAAICKHCPMCEYGRRHPDAWLGRVLHHPWHADHCPFWKAERAVASNPDRPTAEPSGPTD